VPSIDYAKREQNQQNPVIQKKTNNLAIVRFFVAGTRIELVTSGL
jgi:hypothetical protein